MCGRMLVLGCVFLVAITQSGCVGLFVAATADCKDETPITRIHDIFSINPPANVSTKAEFLKDWGKPDEIISTSENGETWIYNRKLWCGVIPVVLLPVPLMLPVCDGFDRLEFQGNETKSLHTRHTVLSGFAIGAANVGGADPACRHTPLPSNNGVDSDAAKPAVQVVPSYEAQIQPNLKWDAFSGLDP